MTMFILVPILTDMSKLQLVMYYSEFLSVCYPALDFYIKAEIVVFIMRIYYSHLARGVTMSMAMFWGI